MTAAHVGFLQAALFGKTDILDLTRFRLLEIILGGEAAIEAGADDVETTDEGHTVYCTPDELHQVGKALEERFGQAGTMQILWRPKLEVPIDEDAGGKLLRMIDALEDSDDVQQVYANFDLSDEVLQKLTAA